MNDSQPRLACALGLLLSLSSLGQTPELPKPLALEGKTDARGVTFTADGKRLVFVGQDGLRLVEVPSGKVVKKIDMPEKSSGHVAISPDSKFVAVQGWDGLMRVWDMETEKIVHTQKGKGNTPVPVAFTKDGKALAMGAPAEDRDFTIRAYVLLLDTTTWKVQQTIKVRDNLYSLALSPDNRIAVGPASGLLDVYSTDKAHLLAGCFLGNNGETCNSISWRSDGQCLAVGGWGNVVNVWTFERPVPAHKFGPHKGGIHSVVFQPNSNLIASCDGENKVALWDAAGKGALATQTIENGGPSRLTFSADGKWLVGSGSSKVMLWDVSAFKVPIAKIPLPPRPVYPKVQVKGEVTIINLNTGTFRVSWKKEIYDQYREVEAARFCTKILLDGKEIPLNQLQLYDEVEVTFVKDSNQAYDIRILQRPQKPGVPRPSVTELKWRDGSINTFASNRTGFEERKTLLGVEMKAGMSYKIAVVSRQIAPILVMEDAAGNELHKHEGTAPEKGQLGKVEFTFKCTKDGNYRFQLKGSPRDKLGTFNLDIREIKNGE